MTTPKKWLVALLTCSAFCLQASECDTDGSEKCSAEEAPINVDGE